MTRTKDERGGAGVGGWGWVNVQDTNRRPADKRREKNRDRPVTSSLTGQGTDASHISAVIDRQEERSEVSLDYDWATTCSDSR